MFLRFQSLRSIRIATLRRLLGDVVNNQYLGGGTEEFATAARATWKDLAEGRISALAAGVSRIEARRLCVEATAAEIRAAIQVLEAISDDVYATETAELPLSYWGMDLESLGYHARARGIEGRWVYERFTDFGHHKMDYTDGPGMGAWLWFHVDTDHLVSLADRERILGPCPSGAAAVSARVSADAYMPAPPWHPRCLTS